MERHTMQDGTIPLSGLSPSAVSRQWGKEKGYEITYNYPIAMTTFFTAFITHLDNSPAVYHDRIAKFQIHSPLKTSLTIVADEGTPESFVLVIGKI